MLYGFFPTDHLRLDMLLDYGTTVLYYIVEFRAVYVPAAMDTYAIIEVLLEKVFYSVRARVYKEDN
jgi:hypothetical protein